MINRKYKNKIKEQKGSITIFVLISIIFLLIVLGFVYISIENRNQAQRKELESIKEVYSVDIEDMKKEYENITKAL